MLLALLRARASRPRSFGISTLTRDVVGHVDARQHLRGVGELRDHVGAHEARHLQAPQAGARERVDQLDLVVGRDRLGLVLKAVARADLADADGLGRLAHRLCTIERLIARSLYSPRCHPTAADPVAIIGASGALGFGLALRFGRAGVPIAIGSRDADRARGSGRRARATRSDGAVCTGLRERRGGAAARRS